MVSEIKLINEFEEQWQILHLDNPEMYPLKMSNGDWDEQFSIFCEQKNQKSAP